MYVSDRCIYPPLLTQDLPLYIRCINVPASSGAGNGFNFLSVPCAHLQRCRRFVIAWFIRKDVFSTTYRRGLPITRRVIETTSTLVEKQGRWKEHARENFNVVFDRFVYVVNFRVVWRTSVRISNFPSSLLPSLRCLFWFLFTACFQYFFIVQSSLQLFIINSRLVSFRVVSVKATCVSVQGLCNDDGNKY